MEKRVKGGQPGNTNALRNGPGRVVVSIPGECVEILEERGLEQAKEIAQSIRDAIKLAYGGNMEFVTQVLINGNIQTYYTGDDWDKARHAFTAIEPGIVKEHWICVNGRVSPAYHKRYAGAPTWRSLSQETRDYLIGIGVTETV